MAAREGRILVTIDTDFGRLIQGRADHAGLIRLPDVPAEPRIHLLAEVLLRHADDVAAGAVLTVKSGRVRISKTPPRT
jgi:predicted nuclease of predicted toxin-antitoxin system